MGLPNPGRALGRSSLLSICLKRLTLSGILPFSINSFRLASSPCFARWTQSFISDWRAFVVFQNHKSRSFRVRRDVPQRFVLGPVLFSLFINDLPASLPSSVSCSLYVDDLVIGLPLRRSPLRQRPHQELCFDWSASLSTVVFLSIQANVRSPFSQWIPTKFTSSPFSSYSNPASVSIPLQSFLRSSSIALFPLLNMYLC